MHQQLLRRLNLSVDAFDWLREGKPSVPQRQAAVISQLVNRRQKSRVGGHLLMDVQNRRTRASQRSLRLGNVVLWTSRNYAYIGRAIFGLSVISQLKRLFDKSLRASRSLVLRRPSFDLNY